MAPAHAAKLFFQRNQALPTVSFFVLFDRSRFPEIDQRRYNPNNIESVQTMI